MYLKIIIIYTVLIKCYINADCGCTTNRNNQNKECTKDAKSKTLHKYTEEANIVQVEDDLDPSEHFNLEDMVLISGSKFEMGTNKPVFPSDHEGPARNISMISFYLDKYEVSNEKFSKFISETGYKSEAEIFGDSFIFEMLVKDKDKEKYKDFRVVSAPWWIKMDKVDWKHPEGPGSTLYGRMDHPVVHVSWNDAVKYCEYLNKRLPTEAEWEYACRGGLRQKLYPWGNKLMPNNKHWANIWQGEFPASNTVEDGYLSTCPVDKFPQNKFGLHNMAGNVWEWTQDVWLQNSIIFIYSGQGFVNNPNIIRAIVFNYFRLGVLLCYVVKQWYVIHGIVKIEFEHNETLIRDERVKKGGSYLCHESYCWRYRCAARSQNTKDSSAGNLGFRCASDV